MAEPSRSGDARESGDRQTPDVELSATEARGGKVVMGRRSLPLWIAGIVSIVVLFVLIVLFARPG